MKQSEREGILYPAKETEHQAKDKENAEGSLERAGIWGHSTHALTRQMMGDRAKCRGHSIHIGPVEHKKSMLFVLLLLKRTKCRPSKERRCNPDGVLKNEGSMMQTCRSINVHVVNTDIC